MSLHRLVLAAACALGTLSVHAADFPITLHADDDSRWYDFYMGYFAELSRQTGGLSIMYDTEAEPDPFNPTVYSVIGSPENAFPSGATFAGVGTLSYNGTGDGTHAITALTLDFGPHVGGTVGALGTSYTTTISNLVGTVAILAGQVDSVSLSADIRFNYDATFIVPNWRPAFDGNLVVEDDRLEIFAHGVVNFGHGALEHAWDIRGTVANVGSTDVIFRSDFE